MAILDVAKKGLITIKTAAGYVKILPRTLATLVEMSDGKSVEEKITELNSNILKSKTVAERYTVDAKSIRTVVLTAASIGLSVSNQLVAMWTSIYSTNPTLYFVSNDGYNVYIGNNSSTPADIGVMINVLYK